MPRVYHPPPTTDDPYKAERQADVKAFRAAYFQALEQEKARAEVEFRQQVAAEEAAARERFHAGQMDVWGEQQFALMKSVRGVHPSQELQAWVHQERQAARQTLRERVPQFETDLQTWRRQQFGLFWHQLSTWETEQTFHYARELESQFKREWQPKSLAERILDIKLPPIMHEVFSFKTQLKFFVPKPVQDILMPYLHVPTPKHALAGVAGFVASFESLAYGAATLAGVKTPRRPPTLSGAVLGSGIQSLVTGELAPSKELETIMGLPPEYAMGSLLADFIIMKGTSKALQKIDVVLGSPIARFETWALRKATKGLVGTRLDKWMYQHSNVWRELHPFTSPQYVSSPRILPVFDPKQVTELSKFIYPMLTTPKTSGLFVSHSVFTPPARHLPTFFGITGVMAEILPPKDMFRELSFVKATRGETTLADLVTAPARLTQPSLASLLPRTTSVVSQPRLVSFILGASVIGLTGQVSQPRPRPRPAPILAPVISPVARVAQVTAPSQVAKTILKTKTKQVVKVGDVVVGQLPILPSKIILAPRPKKREKRKRHIKRIKKRKKRRIERYELLYPVATTSQVSKWILGKTKK